MGLSPGMATALSSAGVTSFKGNREHEKKDMQNLNERLASYIEKMHYKDAEIQRLVAENEALRNRKGQDLQPIRDMYENELEQARNVIDEMSAKQGIAEAKVEGLQDEIARLNDLITTYETQAIDYRKKLGMMDSQIGELEGELASLRARMGGREDEGEKQRTLVTKYQDQIRNMRMDLDQSTAAHIEAEVLAQTKTEEASFYKDMLDQMESMKPEPITIKGMDAAEFWQTSMKKALREIQAAADEKVDMIQQDAEAKVSAQMATMRSSGVKESMQVNASKEEVSRLKSQMAERNSAFSAMQQKIASLTSENDELKRQLSAYETEMDSMRVTYDGKLMALTQELDSVMSQLQVLMDAKLSLELEIACYNKLLQGEESRTSLSSMVSSATGSQSSGAASLASALGGGGGGGSSSMSQSMGKMTVQRSSKGAVGFASVDHAGGNVIIECDAVHAQARAGQNLQGWKVQKSVGGKVTFSCVLTAFNLNAGGQFTIWAKGAKDVATSQNEMIADAFSFGVGTCNWTMFDANGQEKATLNATVS